jgi:hypothetical protein
MRRMASYSNTPILSLWHAQWTLLTLLGFSAPQVGALQQVAFDQLAAEGTLGTAQAKPPVSSASPAKCTALR